MVLNVGDYVSNFPSLTLQTFAFDRPTEWLNSWTLFFWAWWIAWASFVGLFLARISRGRTIRQFVAGTLTIPFIYVVMWISIFGNSALSVVRNGNEQFGQTAMNQPAQGFYNLLQQYPGFIVVGTIATLVGLLFYITSADSGALVMANLSSYLKSVRDDAPLVGQDRLGSGDRSAHPWRCSSSAGVPALQNATIVMGLPFAFVLILVMYGLYKALRVEGYREDSRRQSMPARLSGRSTTTSGDGQRRSPRTWQQRLRRTMSFPDHEGSLRVPLGCSTPGPDRCR